MKRCIAFISTALVLIWALPGLGQEADAPPSEPEATEQPPEGEAGAAEEGEGAPAEEGAEPAPGAPAEEPPTEEPAPGEPAEEPPLTATEEEIVDPFAGDEPVEPPAAVEEELPPPALETVAPEVAGEVEASGEAAGGAEEEERVRVGTEEQYSDALPFRNSRLIYENIFSAYQLNRGNDLTYNPYYAMSLSIQPRWYFTDELSVRLRFDIEGELTNADDTTEYHETRVSDLYLDVVYNPIYTIPRLDLDIGVGLRVMFPTSLESRADDRYLALGPDLRLGRVFDVLDGLVLAYTFRYMGYLSRYTDQSVEPVPLSPCIGSDPLPSCMHSGKMNPQHSFSNAILLSLDFLRDQWRPMNFSIMVIFFNTLNYRPPATSVDVLAGGGSVDVPANDDAVRHVASIWYIFELGLEITDYLSVAIGTSTFSPQLRPNSTYETPFFNRYTNVYVDLTLGLERMVAAIRR